MRRPMPYAIVGEARSIEELQAAIDATTAVNRSQLRSGGIPPLYASGVVYEREARGAPAPGVERFQTARDAWLLGHSDCDGLAPWRAAELLEQGEQARAVVVPSASGYHVIVRRADGSTEDPSAMLGMLDGVGIGDDPSQSARARRRRIWAGLAAQTERLLAAAAGASGAQRVNLLTQAAASTRALRGMERQAHAEGQPPLTAEEVRAAGGLGRPPVADETDEEGGEDD